jgi:hypothetical protein
MPPLRRVFFGIIPESTAQEQACKESFMKSQHIYLNELLSAIRGAGLFVGTLLILLGVPGIVGALTVGDNAARVLPWLPLAVALFSGLLCAIGVSMVLLAGGRFLRFSLLARRRVGRSYAQAGKPLDPDRHLTEMPRR